MRTHLLIATAAAGVLFAGAAIAQSAPNDTSVNPPSSAGVAPPSDSTQPAAPSQDRGPAADANSSDVAPAAGAPAERAPAANVGGGEEIVSNGPIPDTRANRAKYGQPMSQTGKMTKPAGN
jgi:hypothetical protein